LTRTAATEQNLFPFSFAFTDPVSIFEAFFLLQHKLNLNVMKRITLFLLSGSILCFTTCNNEPEPGNINPGKENNRQDPQKLELFMPAAETVNLYSTATPNECMIDTVWVLVFDGTTKRWIEKIGRSEIQNNGRATQLLPQLSHKLENGNTVICIANAAPNPDTTNVTRGNINTCFQPSRPYYTGNDYLPMYGKIDSWSATASYTCPMTRAVAKIQVQMGLNPSDVTGNFNPENVTCQLYNHPTSGYIEPSPSPSGISGGGPPTSPFHLLQKAGATEAETDIFIHEYPFATHTIAGATIGAKNFHANRLHLILTKGSGAAARYYRIDFFNPSDSTFSDIKRNHHYLFTINKIRSEGYATPNQAQNLPGGNIEYTVRITDHSQFITSNGQYAIVTSVDTIKITGNVSNETVATFRYINPTGIALTSIDNSITVDSGSIRPVGATLSITSTPSTIAETNRELKITTSGNPTEGIILFRLGNITHRLSVKQSP
jgi:hypothetical protein